MPYGGVLYMNCTFKKLYILDLVDSSLAQDF